MSGPSTGALRRDAERGLTTDVPPLFLTYFMVDWGEVAQSPSETDCLSCGGKMMAVERIRDKKGSAFDGIVCHGCKAVLWTKA
ncbi:MAG: hypothetical protein JRM86_01030 [Nitrososphaerota archaeon]|nr:hypothetical protein [Nitrososphaerota archaeon]MDG6978326.1 hypothetical protein [Nitrososphaerota archaeon]MDG7005501.1 hypothetical protein [Nitrososphaerota archaeon]MDG7021565.1 hypothetical protein [Nitrososphaerota archaeon]